MTSRPTPQRRASGGNDSPTRSALLAAARSCVAQHGIAGTTSRMIAATAGANLASLTYYFGSKDELLAEALVGELVTRLDPVFAVLENDDASAPDRLVRAIALLAANFEQSRAELPVFLDALVWCSRHDDSSEPGRRILADLQNRLAAVIAALKECGLVAAWTDPAAMAALLVSAGYGIALTTSLQPNGPTMPAVAAQMGSLLLLASTDSSS